MSRILPIFFAASFVILLVILIFQNRKQLVTFNDLAPIPKQPSTTTGPITAPSIYQLVYISSSHSTWTFKYNKDLANDFKRKRINYLLVNGTLYHITGLEDSENDTQMQLTLEASCNNASASSFVGSTCTQPSWESNTTLFALAYYFQDANP